MIKVIDSGKGTLKLAVNKIGSKCYIDSVLVAGEQSPTCNEENIVYLTLPLMQWEAFCKSNHPEKNMEEQKEKLAHEILKEYSGLKEKISEMEWKELVKKDLLTSCVDYYLKKLAVYERLPMLKEVMAIEKRFEKTN